MVACEDLIARLSIAYREARHIQLNIAYWVNDKELLIKLDNESESDSPKPFSPKELWGLPHAHEKNQDQDLCYKPSGADNFTWTTRPVATSVQQIKCNLWEYLIRAEHWRDKFAEYNQKEPINSSELRQFYLTQTILRLQAGEVIATLGQIQDRLGQTLENIRPGELTPTVRRRKEKGLTDKFLSTISRWTFRDLAILVKEQWQCSLPYGKNLPVVIQYWEHDLTSAQDHIFHEQQYHDWREEIRKPDEYHWYSSQDANQRILVPAWSETVILQLSYWMLERPALHPILAHELGHRVIHDVLADLDTQALTKSETGLFGRLARRIFQTIDRALPNYTVRAFSKELLCDLLGASRFGYAYLYSWFLEILAYHQFDKVWLMDELHRLDSEPQSIFAKCEFVRNDLRQAIPEDYLRGRLLLAWLEQMELKQDDPFADSLHQAVEKHLHCQMQARFEEDLHSLQWKNLGDMLVHAITHGHQAPQQAKKLLIAMQNDSPPTNGADSIIWKQAFSPAFQKLISKRLQEHLRESASSQNKCRWINSHTLRKEEIFLWGAVDLPWRLEWLLMDSSFLSTCAMEDYLAQTYPPCRLFTSHPVTTLPEKCKGNDIVCSADVIENSGGSVHSKHTEKAYSRNTVDSEEQVNSHLPCLWLDTEFYLNHWHNVFGTNINGVWWKSSATFQFPNDVCMQELHGVKINPQEDVLSWVLERTSEKKEQNYFMDLLVFAGKAPKKEFSVKIKVLGIYDLAIVTEYNGLYCANTTQAEGARKENRTHLLKDPTLNIHCVHNAEAGSNNEKYFFPYFDRRRLIRKINIPNNTTSYDWEDSHVIVLISLHFPGLRSAFLNWINANIKTTKHGEVGSLQYMLRNILFSLYRSSGWEDFVLFFKLPAGNATEDINIRTCFDIVTNLAVHPMIRKTYTIFSDSVLEDLWPAENNNRPSYKFAASFHIVAKNPGIFPKQLRKKLEDQNMTMPSIIPFSTTGETDFTIFINDICRNELIKIRNIILSMPIVVRLVTNLHSVGSE
ncbi:hypothetical protein [Candidatus Magnetaquicoccus inordinatus]|uniref:hypothetical protein n=1 Tax=Candidatus Magnetaquicoccus inordinatus TaxID=2496818 RepID=UPI00102B9C13|nr:hypothetical protein [Candidatus Magnetaquicoccus inordinatus]